MASFRHGAWVSTAKAVPGAHTTPDGRSVGIYQRAYTDARGESVAAHVAFVRPDRADVTRLSADGNSVESVRLRPDELPDLVAIADPTHLPGA